MSDTGTRYVGSGHNGDTFNTGPGRAETFTFVGLFRLVSRGSGDNSAFRAVFHVTVDANGEVKSEFERFGEGVFTG